MIIRKNTTENLIIRFTVVIRPFESPSFFDISALAILIKVRTHGNTISEFVILILMKSH